MSVVWFPTEGLGDTDEAAVMAACYRLQQRAIIEACAVSVSDQGHRSVGLGSGREGNRWAITKERGMSALLDQWGAPVVEARNLGVVLDRLGYVV